MVAADRLRFDFSHPEALTQAQIARVEADVNAQIRHNGAVETRLMTPDDAIAGELILAHAEQRGLQLPPSAADYLVPRLTRSYAAIERVVAEIDRLSLERKLPATMSVWRDALDAVEGPEQGRLL